MSDGSHRNRQRIMNEELNANFNICNLPGSSMNNDVLPSLTDDAARIPFLNATTNSPPMENMTCAEWNSLAIVSRDCLELRAQLSRQCCDNLPSLYECKTVIDETLHLEDANYKQDWAPAASGDALDVSISLEVFNMEIVDHGIDGGTVEVTASLQLRWVDERLKWNSSAVHRFRKR